MNGPLLERPPGKLKMVECKAILNCSDKEWTEIGAVVPTPPAAEDSNANVAAGNYERIRLILDVLVRPEV
jgi:hypothetical protein